jgi:hypothetical protein
MFPLILARVGREGERERDSVCDQCIWSIKKRCYLSLISAAQFPLILARLLYPLFLFDALLFLDTGEAVWRGFGLDL